MKCLFLLFLSLLIAVSLATTVTFTNKCKDPIDVIRTANNQQPTSEGKLEPGKSLIRAYDSNGMNFKNGAQGKTLAEFSFNSWNNMDFYDLSVVDGYDIAMRIVSSTGGPTVTCTKKDCPEAKLFPKDDTKTHGTKTGGTFDITFCP